MGSFFFPGGRHILQKCGRACAISNFLIRDFIMNICLSPSLVGCAFEMNMAKLELTNESSRGKLLGVRSMPLGGFLLIWHLVYELWVGWRAVRYAALAGLTGRLFLCLSKSQIHLSEFPAIRRIVAVVLPLSCRCSMRPGYLLLRS